MNNGKEVKGKDVTEDVICSKGIGSLANQSEDMKEIEESDIEA